MRLDRYLANNSGLSRSEVKKLISRGAVRVDGAVIRDAKSAVGDNTQVTLQGQSVSPQGPRYLMLNKPAGVICATSDGDHTTVLDLLPAELARGLHPAGRLDIDTTGLVLLTDDGDWSHRVTSPRRQCPKRYVVGLAEPLCADAEQQLAVGLSLRNDPTATLPARLARDTDRQVRLTISEGRYHQVKRMMAALGNRVLSLHRDRIGAVELDPALAPGEYRALTPDEINSFNTTPNTQD